MAGLLYNTVISYVDDATVVAKNFDSMITNLEEVLQRFAQANIKLRPSKCFLFQHEVDFLGHIVSAAGRRVSPRRIACLDELSFPKDIHELRRVRILFI